ncbi:MAG: HAD hydrolase-like protein [Lachnospiraceae bacterium]|nr:HAD hydrolase-like protein [Lachnospiraceae bacterium]
MRRACGVKPDYRYIYFDLDGTLTQSEFGIVDSVIYALEKFGIAGEDREKLKKFIGPALFESFQKYYHFNKEDADRAVAYYREYYESEGIYRAPLYDGVGKMLHDLKDMGKKLYVVTAKPLEMAEKVLRHTGIDGYFEAVVGPDRSARQTDKASLIRRAMQFAAEAENKKELKSAKGSFADSRSEEAEDAERIREIAAHSLMVGDRHFDMEGAVQTGVDSLGVLYGYGDRQELCWAGAAYLACSPAEAAELIGKM